MRIGIIGKGFVGSAVEYGFSCDEKYKLDIFIYDKNPKLANNSLKETVNSSDIIFLSVPTPVNRDGSINLNIVDSALNEINDCVKNNPIVLIRSTITPGTSQIFQEKYPKINIVFNPEFLTENNAKQDFINQSRIILGGDDSLTEKVAALYRWRFGEEIDIIKTNFETAEFIKYMSNCFLATKVSFMNEMKIIADYNKINWDKAVKGFIADKRIGNSHTSVPGPDGKLGFGGSCFPKDIQAFINYAEKLDINPKILKAAWETNLHVRPEKDWEKLIGRAVSNDTH
jgi:nucleotide sugar dehydrogenase